MNPRELERLLGGYAAGTLTESEHGELMRAALEDQQLFDALADEEALRDALADPVFRARLRARLAPEAAPEARSLRWIWWLAPVMAAGLALVFVVNRPRSESPMQVASMKAPQSPEVAAPQAQVSPAPASAPKAADKEALSAGRARTVSDQPAQSPAAAPVRSAAPTGFAEPRPAAPPPAVPAGAPPPTAESVSLSNAAPVVIAEKKAGTDELRKAASEADAAPRGAVGATATAPQPPPPPPPPVLAARRPASPSPAAANTGAGSPSASGLTASGPTAAVAFELQVERSVNGRFESAELGALRQGDRVRFRVRAPESGTLVMTAGRDTAISTLAEAGRTYYLPNAAGLPPGEAPVEIAIALRPAVEGERGNLLRARQQAVSAAAGSATGGFRAAEPLRDAQREDSKDKAKEEAAKTAVPTAQAASAPAPPRELRLRLEFKPR